MAKKRKKTTHRRRHHRVGAMRGVGGIFMKVAAIAAGAAGATFINSTVKKSFASLPAWAGGMGAVGAGVLLPRFVRNPIALDVSAGLIAAGSLFALNESFLSLPGIAGLGAIPKTMAYRNTPKLQSSVGAPGYMDNAVGGERDLMVVGALFDN
jgi:hypothetical protein